MASSGHSTPFSTVQYICAKPKSYVLIIFFHSMSQYQYHYAELKYIEFIIIHKLLTGRALYVSFETIGTRPRQMEEKFRCKIILY